MTTTKRQPWEGIAVDLIFKSKEAVTLAVLACNVDLQKWIEEHVDQKNIQEPFFVFTYFVTIH